MPAEYTYFRAKGASLTAVDAMKEAEKEIETLESRLARHFGADSLYGELDRESGHYKVDHFTFLPPKKIPDGWRKLDRYDTSALPPPGSPAEFYTVAVAGLMDRAAKRARLEDILKSGDMPPRRLPAGRYSTRFVRYQSLEDPDAPPPQKAGSLAEEGVDAISGAITAEVHRADPLAALKLGDDWFIRVPNRPGTEEPLFTPPDAVRVSYEKMLREDEAEQTRRYYRLRAESMGWGC